jgi:hypothetical protein
VSGILLACPSSVLLLPLLLLAAVLGLGVLRHVEVAVETCGWLALEGTRNDSLSRL